MGNDWIVHVLADLQLFAQENDLPLLAVQLEETAVIASAEIGAFTRGAPFAVCGDAAESRPLFTPAGASRSA